MLLPSFFRRKRLRSRPFPTAWQTVLTDLVPLYRRLPPEDRLELHGHIQIFLQEKHFEGVAGFEVTEAARVMIAGQACLLLLHRDTDYFPSLISVVVYPDEYRAPVSEMDEFGVVTEGFDVRSGETWEGGSLVLSWEDVMIGSKALDGYNVVLHECAHQLDAEDGLTSEDPRLPASLRQHWVTTLRSEYDSFCRAVADHRPTLLDPYGAEHLTEFFAVATESFFECPGEFKAAHRLLYDLLAGYYRQDPANAYLIAAP